MWSHWAGRWDTHISILHILHWPRVDEMRFLVKDYWKLRSYITEPRWLSGLRRSRVHSLMIARRSFRSKKHAWQGNWLFKLDMLFLQVITQICQMIIGPVSLIFCGHLGDAIQLDGAALAICVSISVYMWRMHVYMWRVRRYMTYISLYVTYVCQYVT